MKHMGSLSMRALGVVLNDATISTFADRIQAQEDHARLWKVFTDMEKWVEIRRRVLSDEISKRAACAEYEIHWETLQKILTHSEPPGYRRTQPRRSKLEPFLPIIHEILRHPLIALAI